MQTSRTIFGSELAVAFIFLLLFGVLYNSCIEKFAWLQSRRSTEHMTLGILVTLLASGIGIGWEYTLKTMILLMASGVPIIIGSYIRTAKDHTDAVNTIEDISKGAKNKRK